MRERALITGVAGFVGSHLAEYLLSKGLEVYGLKRKEDGIDNIRAVKEHLTLITGDMNDYNSLKRALKRSEPDYVYHLAAQAHVPTSWKTPAETMEVNAIGTIFLLEAVRSSGSDPRIQIAGSSEEYGLIYPDELPVRETNQLRPLSPYGVSKVAADLIGWQYYRAYGLKTVRTRAFNHTGPRSGAGFVASNFAKQIAEIEKGASGPVMRVGNLSAQRDFLDVRDVVRAYHMSLASCDFGEAYNICSEKPRTIRSVLDILLSLSSRGDIKVEADPGRMRPSDIPVIYGSCDKFSKKTGWKPLVPFEKTMEALLSYWRGE